MQMKFCITKAQVNPELRRVKNKAGYTATLVACGWAGAVMEKVTGELGRSSELKTLKNAKKVKWGPNDRPTDRPTNGQSRV